MMSGTTNQGTIANRRRGVRTGGGHNWVLLAILKAMISSDLDLCRLRHRLFVAEMFMLGCGILAFGWIGAALVLIVGEAELRQQMLHIFGYLLHWLAVIPVCGFGVCWFWRRSLVRRISKAANEVIEPLSSPHRH